MTEGGSSRSGEGGIIPNQLCRRIRAEQEKKVQLLHLTMVLQSESLISGLERRKAFLPLGMSLRRSARSGRGLREVEVTPRPGLRRCSYNDTAARIPGIQTRTITSMNRRGRRNEEVDRSEDREESSEEMRGQVERSCEKRNSDSEAFEGSWTKEGSKNRVSHTISHRQPGLVSVRIRALAAG